MTIIEDIEGKVKEWIFNIAIKKAVVSLAKALVAYFMANGIQFAGTIGGLAIDTNSVLAMTLVINSILTVIRNYVKIKFPKIGKYI